MRRKAQGEGVSKIGPANCRTDERDNRLFQESNARSLCHRLSRAADGIVGGRVSDMRQHAEDSCVLFVWERRAPWGGLIGHPGLPPATDKTEGVQACIAAISSFGLFHRELPTSVG